MAATDGNDVLTGTKNADVIDGGAGDDIINSGAGNDTVSGGEGDDQIHAGSGDDRLDGGDGNDQLSGDGGNDILTGGNGDDLLNGGGGSDTFVFNFTVSQGSGQTVSYEPVPLDYDAGGPRTAPDGQVSQSEFSQFQQDYQAWLAENAPADYEYSAPQPDPLTSDADPQAVDGTVSSVDLTNGQTRYWEDTITTGGSGPEITASDGNDTIVQFQNGPNSDTLVLNGLSGLSDDQLDALFDLAASDVNSDGTLDTVLSWDGGSITILGTSEWGSDVTAFFGDDRVHLA